MTRNILVEKQLSGPNPIGLQRTRIFTVILEYVKIYFVEDINGLGEGASGIYINMFTKKLALNLAMECVLKVTKSTTNTGVLYLKLQ